MKCSICGIEINSVDDAAENDWTPYFYDGTQRHDVACPSCSQTLLGQGDHGELEVKDEFRGKLKYLRERRHEPPQEHLAIGIAIIESDPGKLN